MLRMGQSRAAVWAAAVAVAISFTIPAAGASAAKPRPRKAVVEKVVAEPAQAGPDIEIPAMPGPARFFTISAVLAKRDHSGKPAANGVQVASAGTASASDAAAKVVPQVSDQPFGLFVFRAPDGILWTKWRTVEARMAGDSLRLQVCRSAPELCGAADRALLGMMREARQADGAVRAAIVNRSVNAAVRYVSDYEQHGVADLWSSPLATLATGQGDCEDYAIAKYMLLRELGVAEADLKLLLVRDNAVRQDHAVLGVRVDGRWLVLDNRRAMPLESDEVAHFTPLFAIDHDGVGLFAAPYAEHISHESASDLQPAADAAAAGGGLSRLPLLL